MRGKNGRKWKMPEMLSRGQSGSLESLLKVLNVDFLWLSWKRREVRAKHFTKVRDWDMGNV